MIVSVIVPVYNVERYIRRCVDSILEQTYQELELILVDDGAKDASGQICDEYIEKDKRVKVIHQLNGGVSTARNAGLDIAKGEWCCFIDSDDWVDSSYLQNFVDALDGKADLILQSFIIDNEINGMTKSIVLMDRTIIGRNHLIQYLEDAKDVHNGFLWHRLFKMKYIQENNIRFPVGISFAEDGWFFLEYMRYANVCNISSKAGYHYGIRKGSLTTCGKKMPIATFKRLFEGFMDNMMAFDVPDTDKTAHLRFVRRYGWRLAEGWFVKPAYLQGNQEAMEYIKILFHKYGMADFVSKRKSLSVLVKMLHSNFNMFMKRKIVLAILAYRNYENKILRRI